VLLLDEPFASLDPELREALRREVRSILRASGTTAVVVTHDVADAEAVGDRVVTLRAGRLVE
jgi:iron(III) transport system ATP-binding protein